jgi:hypothetical protein
MLTLTEEHEDVKQDSLPMFSQYIPPVVVTGGGRGRGGGYDGEHNGDDDESSPAIVAAHGSSTAALLAAEDAPNSMAAELSPTRSAALPIAGRSSQDDLRDMLTILNEEERAHRSVPHDFLTRDVTASAATAAAIVATTAATTRRLLVATRQQEEETQLSEEYGGGTGRDDGNVNLALMNHLLVQNRHERLVSIVQHLRAAGGAAGAVVRGVSMDPTSRRDMVVDPTTAQTIEPQDSYNTVGALPADCISPLPTDRNSPRWPEQQPQQYDRLLGPRAP